MDVNRVVELEGELLEAIRQRNRRNTICTFDPEVDSILNGRRLLVGWQECFLTLRPVKGSQQHTLQIRSNNTPPKVFRETRGGWFAIDNVTSHIMWVIEVEQAAKRVQRENRQREAAANLEIRRLNAHPRADLHQVEFLVSLKSGLIDVVVRDLDKSAVGRLTALLREYGIIDSDMHLGTSPGKKLWDHLKDS